MKYKYFLTESSKRLHIIDGCRFSKIVPKEAKKYKTLDDAIEDNKRYMMYCKYCFKEKD